LADAWQAHDGIAHACSVYTIPSSDERALLLTGGSDRCVKIWAVNDSVDTEAAASGLQSEMLQLLGEFVRYKTISSNEACREDCRQGALFLKRVLRDLGAQVNLLAGAEGRNPIVMAVFRASGGPPKKRVFYYGHYDVVPPGQEDAWKSDPFVMSGRDGYLYGRGRLI
jgi:di- and tripeptidase